MRIRTGLKFKVADKTYKVYTRFLDGQWSCLSLNYNEPSLVKQHKIQPPEQWNKQTPKEIKVNWTEAEVRDEWISLKTQ